MVVGSMGLADVEEPSAGMQEAMSAGILTFDHIGLIVPELAVGQQFLQAALGVSRWTPPVHDDGLQVSVQFGASVTDGVVYELVAPLGERSPVAGALRAGKHILNHVAYRTGDLKLAGQRLREQGCYPTGEPQAALAYAGQRVQFFLSPLRFVIELIEKPDHAHPFVEREPQ